MAFDTNRYTKSPFIKGEELEDGERLVLTIKDAEEVTFPSGDTVPVLHFLETDQKLSLNKTRIKKLVELLGDDTDEWVDQKISIYPIPVQFNGKSVVSIAVGKAPSKKRRADVDNDVEFEQAKPSRKLAPPEDDGGTEEDIPF